MFGLCGWKCNSKSHTLTPGALHKREKELGWDGGPEYAN